MPVPHTALHGLWLPLVTPFKNGQLDGASLRRLVAHYAGAPIDGFILGATTGEGMTLDIAELERIAALTRAEVRASGRPIAIYLGLSGSNTTKLCETLDETAAWPIDGYLISTPYYARPSQRGMLQHFTVLAERAAHPLMIYNIPYRTGVNLGNETMLQLAHHDNIVGLKDCCAVRKQSIELLRQRPNDFTVLTGEDAQRFSPARMHNISRHWLMAPTVPSSLRRISKPERSRRSEPCCSQATVKRPGSFGRASLNSPGFCLRSRVLRRSSTGCGASA